MRYSDRTSALFSEFGFTRLAINGGFNSCHGIPFRCEGWPDEALVLRESSDHRAILIVEPDAERADIGLLAFGARGFRDHDDALLIQKPGDGQLRAAAAMLASEGSERCAALAPALGERCVGRQGDAVAPQVGQNPVLRQEWVVFDLYARDRRADLLHGAADHR